MWWQGVGAILGFRYRILTGETLAFFQLYR
jgi:hypothetical protein